MSASTWMERARDLADGFIDSSSRDEHRSWIGVDLSNDRARRGSRALLPLLVLALVAGLGVAALRIDLIRTRYALATAMAEEQRLLEEQRVLIVRKRQLRDPVALAVQARERGFKPPTTVFFLPDPAPPSGSPAIAELPAVAAGPGEGDWH